MRDRDMRLQTRQCLMKALSSMSLSLIYMTSCMSLSLIYMTVPYEGTVLPVVSYLIRLTYSVASSLIWAAYDS